jgi:hypothetical protein
LPLVHRVGIDNVMIEVDYPHSDTTSPPTQSLWRSRFEAAPNLSDEDIRKFTYGNAAQVFRHPRPPGLRP